jgi:cysteine desulfurase
VLCNYDQVLMVYLDYNATTPIDPRARERVVSVLQAVHGNASSVQHRAGQEAAELVEEARELVASLVKASPRSVVFTSGASEAATLAIIGAALARRGSRPSIVVGATEHKAVLAAAGAAAQLTGGDVQTLPVLPDGQIDLAQLRTFVNDSTALVAVMAANNETGVLSPVRHVAEACRRAGALFFCDVTQAAAKTEVDLDAWGVDLAVMSSHKIYGPKGAGALIAPRQVQRSLVPLFAGGGQEHGLRGGTHDTAAIAGFGLAAEIAAKEVDRDVAHCRELTGRLVSDLCAMLPDVELIAEASPRLCNTANLRFLGADAEAIMASMPEVEVSSGSACQSAVPSPSHVLLAMSYDATAASECLRFSVGRPTTDEEITFAVRRVAEAVARVRALSA